ncbi:P-loop NTPase fold protein [Streptomyces monticola]|uniref:P-loop NTPase fold protein n=1 Tax=Streptomyces monticola TaxID=2666263 RepID=A0ABW2JDB0_9ACTN
MARLPDPQGSQAILIGCDTYAELDPIPAIANNLSDLSKVLAEAGGFRQDAITVMANPRHAGMVGPPLQEMTEQATDTLLLYYSGHGLVGEDGQLHLALSDTAQRELTTSALPFASVRNIVGRSPARTRVLILDCCFSGRAMSGFMGTPLPDLAALSEVSGTFTLVSAAGNAMSLARPGEPYTAFTGELIRLLKQGIPGPEEVLTLGAIAAELRHSMASLGYPQPQARDVNGVGSLLGLVRNPAYDPTATPTSQDVAPEPVSEAVAQEPAEAAAVAPSPSVSTPVATSVVTPGEASTDRDVDDTDDVEWSPDAPATVDLLHRAPAAKVLALRLMETQHTEPGTSFLVHLDGPWGSGKSSLLNLLEEQVDDHFLVVRFDAWQQSRLAPAWWSLLTCLRQQVAHGRSRWLRPFVRIRETAARARRTGAPYAMAAVVVALVATVLGYLIWPQKPGLAGWEQQVKAATALLAALATLGAGALLAARLFLWDSVRGARLFEQTQANPMADIAAHFQWLLGRAGKPVVFFIDDLDRCEQAYVVEFLDMVQTLVRTVGPSRDGGTRAAAYVVVAADGTWLRRSYETAHEPFIDCINEPGRPLGYLFLDKLFQLSLPMPALSASARSEYLDQMLRITNSRRPTASSPLQAPHEPDAPDAPDASQSSEAPPRPRAGGDVLERLRRFEEGRAQAVYEAMQSTAERSRTKHTLRKFASVLGDNPRAVKKFLNTYSVLRPIRFLEGIHVDPDALALWSLIRVRWPYVADHLSACPEAVQGIVEPLWLTEHFPEPLRAAAESPELQAVVTSPDGGPLTPELIRQCCGVRRARGTG